MTNMEVLAILNERQDLVRIMDEAEQQVKKLTAVLKDFMGDNTEFSVGPFKITYKEVVKTVADTAAMKAAGIYADYSKPQITRPFTVRT